MDSIRKYQLFYKYEALSVISGKIFATESKEELVYVLQRNLKYLFDYELFRVVINKKPITSLTFSKRKSFVEETTFTLLPYENNLGKTRIPIKEKYDSKFFKKYIGQESFQEASTIAWCHNFRKMKLYISIVQSSEEELVWAEKQFVFLLSEIITAKYLKLSYLEQIDLKNNELKNAIQLIEKRNREIKLIVTNQKEIIEKRSQEIIEKNNTLLEISTINAHTLREPLSRILGLLEVAALTAVKEERDLIIEYLRTSANELDSELQKIITHSVNGLKKSAI